MTASKTRFHFVVLLALVGTLSGHGVAHAQSSATPAQPDPASRYSLPWQLRPVTIGSAARLDGVLAAFNDAAAKVDEHLAQKLGALGAGLKIPGM